MHPMEGGNETGGCGTPGFAPRAEGKELGVIDQIDQDPATTALDLLVGAADEGVTELRALRRDLNSMKEHRIRGWSWRQTVSNMSVPNPLTRMARIGSDLASAGGAFRRALARALRSEGVKVTTIADLFDVSRQRVSTLIRPDAASTDNDQ
jgi:hypothetical protein